MPCILVQVFLTSTDPLLSAICEQEPCNIRVTSDSCDRNSSSQSCVFIVSWDYGAGNTVKHLEVYNTVRNNQRLIKMEESLPPQSDLASSSCYSSYHGCTKRLYECLVISLYANVLAICPSKWHIYIGFQPRTWCTMSRGCGPAVQHPLGVQNVQGPTPSTSG